MPDQSRYPREESRIAELFQVPAYRVQIVRDEPDPWRNYGEYLYTAWFLDGAGEKRVWLAANKTVHQCVGDAAVNCRRTGIREEIADVIAADLAAAGEGVGA